MDISPSDIALMARTMWGENNNGTPQEYSAIAHTMRNRLASGDPQYGGNTMSQILLAPNSPGSKYHQFSPWNDPKSDNFPTKADPRSPAYQSAYRIASDVMLGNAEDPTNGAVNYHASSMKTLPKWAKGREGTQIGEHTFYGPPPSSDEVDNPEGFLQQHMKGNQKWFPTVFLF